MFTENNSYVKSSEELEMDFRSRKTSLILPEEEIAEFLNLKEETIDTNISERRKNTDFSSTTDLNEELQTGD